MIVAHLIKPAMNMSPAALDNIYAIILAAGNSSRFGSPKQLLKLDTRTMLQNTILLAQSILPERVIVILGAEASTIMATLSEDSLRIIENPDWQQGMSSSIRTGVGALPSSCAAALILLCDQPLLNQNSIALLLNTWRKNPEQIVVSRYHDTFGVPAIFPAKYFTSLLALAGDKGAKHLLMQHQDHMLTVPVPEAAADIDTPQDLEEFNSLKYGSSL